jgi:Uma2 family endonuclease
MSRLTEHEHGLVFGGKYELIDGRVLLPPGSSVRHAEVIRELGYRLEEHVRDVGAGRVFRTPIPVILCAGDVVQPDITVCAGLVKFGRGGAIDGIPELIVEVLAAPTPGRDRYLKAILYAARGVSEYWVVSPTASTIAVHVLSDGRYRLEGTYTGSMLVQSRLLPLLELPADAVFDRRFRPRGSQRSPRREHKSSGGAMSPERLSALERHLAGMLRRGDGGAVAVLRGLPADERAVAAMMLRLDALSRKLWAPAARGEAAGDPGRQVELSSLSEREEARQKEIHILERRLYKLSVAFESVEASLKAAGRGRPVDDGISSVYDEVQGLDGEDPGFERKSALLFKVFVDNLALQKGEPPPAHLGVAPARSPRPPVRGGESSPVRRLRS